MRITVLITIFSLIINFASSYAFDDQECLDCHDDHDLIVERDGREISLYVESDDFHGSIHADLGCVGCHEDITDLPHEENLSRVACEDCHDEAAEHYLNSRHQQALNDGQNAPRCQDCHSTHHVLLGSDANSTTYRLNIPQLCSSCHLPQTEKYHSNRHGLALRAGDPTAPTCISCHDHHEVRSSSDNRSKTYSKNIATTCGQCHEKLRDQYTRSLHGRALQKDMDLAPTCNTCHEAHHILPPTDPQSTTYIMNIPNLCGRCHKEGTPVSELSTISETHVLEDYTQSIHGDGLFKRGLIVTAVCVSCHTSHHILPHEDPQSSINRNNIAGTCMQCHTQIESVHLKVINGELWEKRSHEIPACIECHPPHKVRRVYYEEERFTNESCLECHADPNIHKIVDGEKISLLVEVDSLAHSVHKEQRCIRCHTNVNVYSDPICLNSGPVDCSICHAAEVTAYESGYHGRFHAAGDLDVPYCTDCHGDHETRFKTDKNSPTFSINVPFLCGECHRRDGIVAARLGSNPQGQLENYAMSIHGKGLMESGLTVTATCVDCHTAHNGLPEQHPESSVHPKNVARTCAKCHSGVYEEFVSSIHSAEVSQSTEKLPVCNTCHQSHTISDVEHTEFRQRILSQCGVCHEEVTATYFDTFHGKVSKLGTANTARCHDCHGSHNILPPIDRNSTLSRDNIVETCKVCHPNSNRKFVGYLTHATHHDRDKYPYLYYPFIFMTILLVGTFTFFGLHTLLWLPRAVREHWAIRDQFTTHSGQYYQRFDPFSRFLHVLVIISFLSLAITGMTIKFADVTAFQTVARLLGGYQVTGFVHRIAAIMTFLYFFMHLMHLLVRLLKKQISLTEMFTGERSLAPRWQDFHDFVATMKWFFGRGSRPRYSRWTYWEKFDYFAVFWGVLIIGSSGLLLWFPERLTEWLHLPGWVINVATIIHSDEALLATGFIFTVHFFNTHLRPDKFPMDPVIFTGKVPIEEMKYDRPEEYKMLLQTRKISKHLGSAPSSALIIASRIFGFTALTLGIATIVLIIYSMIFLYQ